MNVHQPNTKSYQQLQTNPVFFDITQPSYLAQPLDVHAEAPDHDWCPVYNTMTEYSLGLIASSFPPLVHYIFVLVSPVCLPKPSSRLVLHKPCLVGTRSVPQHMSGEVKNWKQRNRVRKAIPGGMRFVFAWANLPAFKFRWGLYHRIYTLYIRGSHRSIFRALLIPERGRPDCVFSVTYWPLIPHISSYR